MADNKEMSKLAGGVDPISTMINQFNPIVFSANSIKNVEMATRFQTGKSASYMWEAQVLAGIKQPVVAVGNAMTTVGTALLFTGGLSWAGALLLIGGIALNALGNSMQVNPTTGERATKMTDQAAVNTGIGTVTSVLGGLSIGASSVASSASASAEAAKGTADAARLATMAQSAAETANTIQQGSQLVNLMSSVAQAGMQYDAKGNSQGWSLSGMSGDRFATQTGIGLLADGLAGGMTSTGFSSAAFSGGANGVLSATMSQSMNVAVEYHKFKTGAKDQQYTGMVNAGWEGMWNGAYGSAVSAYAGQLATSYSQQNALNNSAWGLDASQKKAAMDILVGASVADNRRRRSFLEGFRDGALGGTADFMEMFGGESGANWMRGYGAFDNDTLQKQREALIGYAYDQHGQVNDNSLEVLWNSGLFSKPELDALDKGRIARAQQQTAHDEEFRRLLWESTPEKALEYAQRMAAAGFSLDSVKENLAIVQNHLTALQQARLNRVELYEKYQSLEQQYKRDCPGGMRLKEGVDLQALANSGIAYAGSGAAAVLDKVSEEQYMRENLNDEEYATWLEYKRERDKIDFGDIWQGVKNRLFDAEKGLEKTGHFADQITKVTWDYTVEHFWERYHDRTRHLNREIVDYYQPQRAAREERFFDMSVSDTEAIGRHESELRNINTGRLIGEAGLFLAETALFAGAGKLVSTGVRAAVMAAARARYGARAVRVGQAWYRGLQAGSEARLAAAASAAKYGDEGYQSIRNTRDFSELPERYQIKYHQAAK
ncbi:MAG: hypothetical protein KDK27_14455, partial [Leptospiraceae bacterium]|nr:hypothetical protein [Leptospiraceae bacterium]